MAALCAGLGDSGVVRELWSAQRSRRLLLLHAVKQAADAEPELFGPLPGAAPAWDALAAAEACVPGEVTRLLLDPQVGGWVAYTLRRHRRGRAGVSPPWVDFGNLHALALAAAACAGLPYRTRLPARFGRVMVPGLGMATLPATTAHSTVYAETVGGRITLADGSVELTVPGSGTDGAHRWWPTRVLEFGSDPRLSILLDDVDPYRDLADPVPPHRLDDGTVERWRRLLDEAWALLCAGHRETAEAMAAGVTSLVPLPANEIWGTRSASSGEAFGRILVSLPPDPTTLAVSLVHEFQHIKLGGLIHVGALARSADRDLLYAPWREDPRPPGGLLQGVYAFAGIAAFWRAQRHALVGGERVAADFEYAYARAQVGDGLRTLAESPDLTPWGRRVVDGLDRRIGPWLVEALPPSCERSAMLAAHSHQAGWRIRHSGPTPSDVEALVEAWDTDGEPRNLDLSETVVESFLPMGWSLGMLALVRRNCLTRDPRLTGRLRSLGVTPADIALVHGDVMSAGAEFERRITLDPDDLAAWVGLGLADEKCPALLDRPALVRAVYKRLSERGGPPSPTVLAAWISSVLGTL